MATENTPSSSIPARIDPAGGLSRTSSPFRAAFAQDDNISDFFNTARNGMEALAGALAEVVGPRERFQVFVKEVPSFLGMPVMAIAVGPSPKTPVIDVLVSERGIQGSGGLFIGFNYDWAGMADNRPYGYQAEDFRYHDLLETTPRVAENGFSRRDKGIFVFEENHPNLDDFRKRKLASLPAGRAAQIWPVYALADRMEGCAQLGFLDFSQSTKDMEAFVAAQYTQVSSLVPGSRRSEFARVFQEKIVQKAQSSRPAGGGSFSGKAFRFDVPAL